MKIVSINGNHTVDMHHVAFNVDAAPANGVMERITYGTLSISFEGNLLRVRAKSSEPPIDGILVGKLTEKISKAESEVATEAAESASKHKQMLEDLSKATGLVIQ